MNMNTWLQHEEFSINFDLLIRRWALAEVANSVGAKHPLPTLWNASPADGAKASGIAATC